ncbi:MAG: hypothetical protein QNJ12_02665 [Ilumatobacter sp.]|uniref:hypothetical protein n=1 Tax=Ilumatobacter sp. TaxID=1967498 RepID=UPI00260564B1|nr:hypothetical protein [Ilumatobacter sp.]MDJ0767661.1 hypothetical protein [Ilumatobacter sp.]
MQDGSGRIEVELTSHEPSGVLPPEPRDLPGSPTGSSAVGGAERATTTGAPRTPGPLGSERARIVLAAFAAGIVALLLGWMLGRAGGDAGVDDAADDRSDETSADTVEADTTTTLFAGDVLPEVDDAISPDAAFPDVAPPPTASATPSAAAADREVQMVAVDARLAGLPLRLVGFDPGDRLVELDLATGELARTRIDRTFADTANVTVGEDWVAVPGYDGTNVNVVDANGEVSSSRLGEPWNLLWQPGTDRFWRGTNEGFRGPTRYEEVTLDGEETGAAIDVPSFVWMVDPRGGLVVHEAGKAYSVDEVEVEYLGAGEVVGISSSQVVLRECDEQMICGLTVLDRASGEWRDVPDHDSADLDSVTGWGLFPASQQLTLSPDGRWCSVTTFATSTPRLELVDLVTGEWHELTRTDFPTGVSWSPDSRFAFYRSSGALPTAFDVTTGESFPVMDDIRSWTSVSVRPEAASSG